MDPISHQPRGKNVDTRTYKAHSVADRQAALRAAEQNAEATIDTQIEEISTYLAACVLTDEVSGPSQSPGSSLWLRCDAFQLQDKPQNERTLSYQHPYHPLITLIQVLVLPLCILHLTKQAQGALKKVRFSHLWPLLKWMLALSTMKLGTALLV